MPETKPIVPQSAQILPPALALPVTPLTPTLLPSTPVISATPVRTPGTTKSRRRSKRPEHKSKLITGYIIYASEIRKEIIKQYPDNEFGYISKIVGTEWKNLPQETKMAYEKRAKEQNAKSKALCAEAKARAIVMGGVPMQNGASRGQLLNSSSMSTDGGDSSFVSNSNTSFNYTASTSFKAPTPMVRRTITATSHPLNATVYANQTNVNVINRNMYAKLKPKDAIVQTEPIVYLQPAERKKLKHSDKFVEYLKDLASKCI